MPQDEARDGVDSAAMAEFYRVRIRAPRSRLSASAEEMPDVKTYRGGPVPAAVSSSVMTQTASAVAAVAARLVPGAAARSARAGAGAARGAGASLAALAFSAILAFVAVVVPGELTLPVALLHLG